MGTSETSKKPRTSIWFAADSPVNRSQSPADNSELSMIVTSGRKCYESLILSGQCGSWARTFLESEIIPTPYVLTWKLLDTKCYRLIFRLAYSECNKSGTADGLFPTPTVSMARQGVYKNIQAKSRRAQKLLIEVVISRNLKEGKKICGRLNPGWIEWLMGYPINWTASNPLAMPLFPKSSNGSENG